MEGDLCRFRIKDIRKQEICQKSNKQEKNKEMAGLKDSKCLAKASCREATHKRNLKCEKHTGHLMNK